MVDVLAWSGSRFLRSGHIPPFLPGVPVGIESVASLVVRRRPVESCSTHTAHISIWRRVYYTA